MTTPTKSEEMTTSQCLEQVPAWQWFLELGYSNGQTIRVPTPDEAKTRELMATFTQAIPSNGWVEVDMTTTICSSDLRYVQVGHRSMPCRVEPIGFATHPSGS